MMKPQHDIVEKQRDVNIQEMREDIKIAEDKIYKIVDRLMHDWPDFKFDVDIYFHKLFVCESKPPIEHFDKCKITGSLK